MPDDFCAESRAGSDRTSRPLTSSSSSSPAKVAAPLSRRPFRLHHQSESWSRELGVAAMGAAGDAGDATASPAGRLPSAVFAVPRLTQRRWPPAPPVEEARRHLPRADRRQRRLDYVAQTRHEIGTAGVKRAARWPVVRVGYRAADRRQLPPRRRIDARNRPQQRPGVGVLGSMEDVVDRSLLDHPAQVHHHHVVGHLGDDP